MERESGIHDAAIGFRAVEKFQHAQLVQVVPGRPVQSMQQIIVDAVGSQFRELGLQIAVHVPAGLDHPRWQLGSDLHPLPVTALQRLSEQHLALAPMVRPGGIKIVYPLLDGVMDQANRPGPHRFPGP